jgi:FkbM family methyltransferase
MLGTAEWLWSAARPFYVGLLALGGRNDLSRHINGTDWILVHPRWRQTREQYEPEVWRPLMDAVSAGDCVVDVGAWIGLHTVAFAKRVGTMGQVIAFEPDPENRKYLIEHVRLNAVSDRVSVLPVAVGGKTALVRFAADGSSQSHIQSGGGDRWGDSVVSVSLDDLLPSARISVLKIDVEGYEEKVLSGASRLLSDPERRPKLICIEVHPYAWGGVGTTSDSNLEALWGWGYQVRDPEGSEVSVVYRYGHVFATARS